MRRTLLAVAMSRVCVRLAAPLSTNAARPTGNVLVRNTQRSVEVDVARLEAATRVVLGQLRCATFDVGIWLTTDATVRRLNRDYRGVAKTTDILSFPFHDELAPGAAPDAVDASNPDLLNLGDLVVSVPYVLRVAERDGGRAAAPADGERGVAAALAPLASVTARLEVLVVHGLCHLLNYDHESDADFEAMVAVEDACLRALKARGFGEDPP
jgi:rRNA maturation RNase YbeY